MQLSVVTLFPEMFSALTDWGISGRAVKRELITLDFFNPRSFATDKQRTVDDKPFGGGPGMLMKSGPLIAAINQAKKRHKSEGEEVKVAYLSPQGTPLDHPAVEGLAKRDRLILVCGRYQGIDERVIEQEIDEEWSIGNFVLSGGELAAMALIDAMIRLQPGALGHEDSAKQDSFGNGLLHWPEYTRPQDFEKKRVPDVLLSGDHGAIRDWRKKQSLISTLRKRPDLISWEKLKEEEKAILKEFMNESRT